MRILVVGGGPAGLYFAILRKLADPSADITVIERNARGVTFGWGVVFSDETLGNLFEADTETHQAITDGFAHWDSIDTHYRGQCLRSTGHGFSGIARGELLRILEDRAETLGVELQFGHELTDFSSFPEYDLVVAADGLNSFIRTEFADSFRPDLEKNACKFIWLGTRKVFDAFTFLFAEAPAGWFTVHAYRFDADTSTFIVETDESTWKAAGYDTMPVDDSVAELEGLFAPWLEGEKLLQNRSLWINFTTVRNQSWHHDNVVLMGDAAHTAHFSIGSGTKLAMEGSIALSAALSRRGDVKSAIEAYETERMNDVARAQRAAHVSRSWFETVPRHTRLEPIPFAFSLMTRSKRITFDNLATRDPQFVEQAARSFARTESTAPEQATAAATPLPMFQPFRLREMQLANRVVVSPMCMYSSDDGLISDFQLVHLGSRALGGAGLVFTEMTNVAADARISPGCAGMYRPEHRDAWQRVVDFVHAHSDAKIATQLGHAGRKGSTRLLWEGMDQPLADGNWPLISASPLPYTAASQTPREMTRADMDRVTAEFVAAARLADEAGFDMLELHMAHGYLLASFLSPLSNVRGDEYGGSHEARLRYPLEVLDAVRAVWPEAKPISCRISAVDWKQGGNAGDDAVVYARALKQHGADIIHVSAGQTVPDQEPVYGRMFQVPFSDQIKAEAGVPTITVGNITSADQVNTILAAGRADLCALARPHLTDPHFTLRAAAEYEAFGVRWPNQYCAVQHQPKPE